MTREEATRYMLQWQQELKDGGVPICSDKIQSLRVAIEALSQPIVCKDYRIDKDHVYCSPELADMVYEALQKHTEDKQWTEETSR